MEVIAVQNDTTGTLIAGSQINPKCTAAIIVGTGSNACYFEPIRKCAKWCPPEVRDGEEPSQKLRREESTGWQEGTTVEQQATRRAYYDGERSVVVNTEWGALGDNGSLNFLRTEFDHVLDEQSLHPQSYTYAKLFDYSNSDLSNLSKRKKGV